MTRFEALLDDMARRLSRHCSNAMVRISDVCVDCSSAFGSTLTIRLSNDYHLQQVLSPDDERGFSEFGFHAAAERIADLLGHYLQIRLSERESLVAYNLDAFFGDRYDRSYDRGYRNVMPRCGDTITATHGQDYYDQLQRQQQQMLMQRANYMRQVRENLSTDLFEAYGFNNLTFSKEAEARALELLKSCLNASQLATYNESKFFYVTGGVSGRRYRIRFGRSFNIDQLDEGDKLVCRWCVTPSATLVTADILVAQKIALESCEMEALTVANFFSGEGLHNDPRRDGTAGYPQIKSPRDWMPQIIDDIIRRNRVNEPFTSDFSFNFDGSRWTT
jgi:hypothetical protein